MKGLFYEKYPIEKNSVAYGNNCVFDMLYSDYMGTVYGSDANSIISRSDKQIQKELEKARRTNKKNLNAYNKVKSNYDNTYKDIKTKKQRGMLGFIEWMEQKPGLTELQKEDLIQAKAVINEALNEKVSSWCPTLRNYYGEDISHKLKFTNGYTAALNYKNDGISYENLMALPDYFVQVKKYYTSKDIYREACLRIYKEKYPEYLGSEGLPRTNFLINASAMVGADRNAFVNYHADPNKWHDDVASEVLYSDDNAEGAILAWTHERKLFDQAKKELKINTSYLTEAHMRELEDLALKKVDGKWYYMNSSGAMKTGWLKLKNKWYYLSSSGVMQTGWYKVKGVWYLSNSSGAWIK